MIPDSNSDFLPELDGLPREASPTRDLWAGIAAQLDIQPPDRKPGARRSLALAAGVALFAMGLGTGYSLFSQKLGSTPWSGKPGHKSSATTVGLTPAILVQQTGTAWVASLAHLAGEPPGPARVQGREAAAAVMHAAALEWKRLAEPDIVAAALVYVTATARDRSARR